MNATSAQSQPDNAEPPRRAQEDSSQKVKLRPIGGLLPKLLYERYRVRENPFGVTPNPRYLYESRSHAEARASLIIGLECGVGFQALIAPPGMGKSTILLSILERFNNIARTAFLFQIHGDSRAFLRCLMSELGSTTRHSDLVGLQEAINQLLICERRAGRKTIIIIDEAQSLDTSVLETVRLLSNFETSTEKLLQIILAGQPQLAQRLASPDLTQLSQRISTMTTLVPFDLEDTTRYVGHRLKIAGYQGQPLFTSEALNLIWEHSRGTPREINKLCFNAMLLAMAVREKQVDSGILQEVVSDFNLERSHCKIGASSPEMKDAQTSDGTRAETEKPQLASDVEGEVSESATHNGPDKIVVCSEEAAIYSNKKETSSLPGICGAYAPSPEAHATVVEAASARTINAETAIEITAVQQLTEQALRANTKLGAGTDHELRAAEGIDLDAPSEEKPQLRVDPMSDFASTTMNKDAARSKLGRSVSSSDVDANFESEFAPDSGLVPESEEKLEPSRLESPSAALDQLTIIPSGDSSLGEAVGSRWTLAREQRLWMNAQWRTHRSTIYLGTSALILLLVLLWAGPLQLSAFFEVLGLTESPPRPVRNFNPKTQVWIDVHTGLYHCTGEEMYGKTPGGKFATQEDAQYNQFQPAEHKACP